MTKKERIANLEEVTQKLWHERDIQKAKITDIEFKIGMLKDYINDLSVKVNELMIAMNDLTKEKNE